MLQQQINQIRRFLSNAQTPDSVIALDYKVVCELDSFACMGDLVDQQGEMGITWLFENENDAALFKLTFA